MNTMITVSLTDEQGTQILGQMMSVISERCWTAGWYAGTEEDLPRVVAMAAATRDQQEWGQVYVWPDEADIIIALASALGHWATSNPDINGVEYLPYQPKGA